jgi:integrase
MHDADAGNPPAHQSVHALPVDAASLATQIYLPFYRRKWKRSTAMTNEDRIRYHLTNPYGERLVSGFRREELQDFLEQKAAAGLSYSVVAHLRWDLRQVFRMAREESLIERSPAELLFVPYEAKRPGKQTMTFDQVRLFLSVLPLRERVIGGLAVLAGMRPGEIFGLTRGKVEHQYADIEQRVYRGEIGTPKTFRSKRWAAFGSNLKSWIREWLQLTPGTGPDGWLFASEKLTTPLSRDNCWRRGFLPTLQPVGLGWVNFQIMRRTHSCLMDELQVDPQVRADQMGHGVDTNQNQYTQASLSRRQRAVEALEKELGLVQ